MRKDLVRPLIIDKPSVIITSLGRTGTRFFANLFNKVFPDCTSLHEPDVVHYSNYFFRQGNFFNQFFEQLKIAGFDNLVVKKLLKQWSLLELSDKRLRLDLENKTLVQNLFEQRNGLVSRQPGSLYVESSSGYYGLLDIVPQVFTNVRAIYIIRDGKQWVRSWMNWGEIYHKTGLRKYLAHTWIKASEINNDPYHDKWPYLSRFEKVCWAWSKLNSFALSKVSQQNDKFIKVIKFEDIFLSENKNRTLNEILNFCTSIIGDKYEKKYSAEDLLGHFEHNLRLDYPAWEDWTADQKKSFIEICGGQMSALGYDL